MGTSKLHLKMKNMHLNNVQDEMTHISPTGRKDSKAEPLSSSSTALCSGEPSTAAIPDDFHEFWAEGKDHLPGSSCNTPPNAAQGSLYIR